jgi:hypothetical protein
MQFGVLYDCVILTVAVFQAERRISGLTGLMRSQTAPLPISQTEFPVWLRSSKMSGIGLRSLPVSQEAQRPINLL